MARILALSSHVAFGSVGLAAIVPALQALGHEVVALPTVVLSNHPGYRSHAGEETAPEMLDRMFESLEANGWLAGIDAVLTGYLPTAAHVEMARDAIERIRAANPALLYICDPVFGDDPEGLYLDEETAEAIREHLLPLADVATPNRLELAWLAGEPVDDPDSAVRAARALEVPTVLATSTPAGKDRLATLLVGSSLARACYVDRHPAAPHGTGDLLAALYLGHSLNGADPEAGLARTVAAVAASIVASSGGDELPLAAARWAQAQPLPMASI
jgi:pyridoxine kinase